MIKTHPLKTFAFFGGCGTFIGAVYYTKARFDTDEEVRKEVMMNLEKLKYQRDCDDNDVRKQVMMNLEKLKYQRESNNEEIQKLMSMNNIYRQRIPWIIRWLM